MENPISAGMTFLTLGFVFVFLGVAGWRDPQRFALANSWVMYEAEPDQQRDYGRLVAGFVGAGGAALMLFGTYMILSPLFN